MCEHSLIYFELPSEIIIKDWKFHNLLIEFFIGETTWEPKESFIDSNGVETDVFKEYVRSHPTPTTGSKRSRSA